jgi:TolC family type I secretion outer membrane protein
MASRQQAFFAPKATLPWRRWLLAGALACASPAWSMDLLQAYQAAQKQDPTILGTRAATDVARERTPQALAQLLPNLQASAARTRNRLVSTAPNFLGQESTSDLEYMSSNQTVQLRQPLYRPYNTALFKQAKEQVKDAEASLAKEEQNLAARVAGAYFEALLTSEQLDLVLAQKQFYDRQLDGARKAFAAGSGIRTDIDEAQARLDLTVAQELEARQNISYTRRQLQAIVNQPLDELAPLDPAKLQLDDQSFGSLESWTDRAEQASPELKSLRAQLEAARLEVDKARAGHKPTLDAVVQWQRSTSENTTSPLSRYTDNSIGVQLSIPLYAGGYVNSQVRAAVADVRRAEEALEATRLDLGTRVNQQYRGVTENIPKIKALEIAVRSAEQLIESSRKSYQAGARTQLDVLNAEQQRTSALRDLAQARYVYLVSRIRLLALVGGADAQAVADINKTLKH